MYIMFTVLENTVTWTCTFTFVVTVTVTASAFLSLFWSWYLHLLCPLRISVDSHDADCLPRANLDHHWSHAISNVEVGLLMQQQSPGLQTSHAGYFTGNFSTSDSSQVRFWTSLRGFSFSNFSTLLLHDILHCFLPLVRIRCLLRWKWVSVRLASERDLTIPCRFRLFPFFHLSFLPFLLFHSSTFKIKKGKQKQNTPGEDDDTQQPN